MPSVAVDGVNVLAVYDAVAAAVARARSGGGPTFIEAPVYRLRAHGGAGDDSHTGYRDVAEREHWEPYDPVSLFEHFLKNTKLLDGDAVAAMERQLTTEIAEAFDFALNSPNPTEEDLNRHVYAE
jgi:TPP-dependent pyruvate/acetoin dehydrogenase alpha subunit